MQKWEYLDLNYKGVAVEGQPEGLPKLEKIPMMMSVEEKTEYFRAGMNYLGQQEWELVSGSFGVNDWCFFSLNDQ